MYKITFLLVATIACQLNLYSSDYISKIDKVINNSDINDSIELLNKFVIKITDNHIGKPDDNINILINKYNSKNNHESAKGQEFILDQYLKITILNQILRSYINSQISNTKKVVFSANVKEFVKSCQNVIVYKEKLKIYNDRLYHKKLDDHILKSEIYKKESKLFIKHISPKIAVVIKDYLSNNNKYNKEENLILENILIEEALVTVLNNLIYLDKKGLKIRESQKFYKDNPKEFIYSKFYKKDLGGKELKEICGRFIFSYISFSKIK